MQWDTGPLAGPDGDDWRVPVSELEARQNSFRASLRSAAMAGAWVADPVDLYWLAGNRQSGGLWVPAEDAGGEVTQFVRASLERARFESGEDDSPHQLVAHPSFKVLAEDLRARGASGAPALQLGRMPASDAAFVGSMLAELGGSSGAGGAAGAGGGGEDCTQLLWDLREVKSDWEIERMRESGEVQRWMFEAIDSLGCEGVSELELAAAADEVSRAAGFAGHIRMRKWPMDCERVVIASGRAGAVPTFFDSAVGATGPHPLAALGAGFKRITTGEPVLVDIVHVHRGYVADMTRMFSVGPLDTVWEQRLADMVEIALTVRESLGRGDDCSTAWDEGSDLATQMGHGEHLMGMGVDQAAFLGHSIGLELDETPVVAAPFTRPLAVGGTMAIEPKVIHPDGAIGVEDCWVKTDDGMSCLSSGENFPLWTEW